MSSRPPCVSFRCAGSFARICLLVLASCGDQAGTSGTEAERTGPGVEATEQGSASAVDGAVAAVRAAGRGAHVLFVTIDTLRADRLGCYGNAAAKTPVLDGLAADGVLFERALAVAPLTLPSHTSMLTGQYPPRHGVRDNGIFRAGEELETLAEVLGREGYATAAFVSAHVLESHYGLAQGFQTYDDHLGGTQMGANLERPANKTVDRALAWLDGADEQAPWFLWLHLFDPHAPYFPPDGFVRGGMMASLAERYDGEIAFADQQLGRVLAALEASGQAARTLVVVTSDHGDSLGAHDEPTHGIFIYDSVMRVPLILRFAPLGGGRRIGGQVSGVDLFPTVLDVLDLPLPAALHGRSLLPELMSGAERIQHSVYMEGQHTYYGLGLAPLAALSSERFKYIEAPRPELYDWQADPGELQNLFEERQDVARELARELDALREGKPPLDGAQRLAIDEDEMAKLRELGYVFAAADGRFDGVDPKDVASIYNELRAQSSPFFARRMFKEVVPLYEKMLELCPGDVPTMAKLGEAYYELDDFERAEGLLRHAASLRPDLRRAAISLANVLRKTDRPEQALSAYQQGMLGSPTDTVILIEAAQMALELGQNDLALAYGQRALDTGALPPDTAQRAQEMVNDLRAIAEQAGG
jgi:choline-sulfatase